MDTNSLLDFSDRERMQALLRLFKSELNTHIPCRVSEVQGNRVTLQLNILRKFNGNVQEPLTLYDVPVVYPGAGDYNIAFKISPGDTGMAMFSQRDIDRWLDDAADVEPDSTRFHSFSDAVFTPGLRRFNDTTIPEHLEITAGDIKLTLTESGGLSINNGTAELVSVLKDIVSTLIGLETQPFTRHSSSVPTPEPISPEAIAALTASLGKLESFG